jgi:hypothetical protein
VVIEHGMIELESSSGVCRSFVAGDVLWLVGLPLRLLRNRGAIPAELAAVSRAMSSRDPVSPIDTESTEGANE